MTPACLSWRQHRLAVQEFGSSVQGFEARLGEQIRKLRKAKGFSQEDMISFGFSARHWQQIEAGRPITVTTLLRICEVFRVPVARLLQGLDKGIY